MTAILEDGCILLDIDAPVPKRWRDAFGPLRVMGGPVEGYVMVRRPRAHPFVLRVSDLCNATERRLMGRLRSWRKPYQHPTTKGAGDDRAP